METVTAYECEPTCPVPLLDAQSGDISSSFRRARTGLSSARNSMAGDMRNDGMPFGYHDSGSASRFYPQFANDEELLVWLRRLVTPVS